MSCWDVTAANGFLMAEEPVVDATPFVAEEDRMTVAEVLGAASQLPAVLVGGDCRASLESLPVPTLDADLPITAAERLHQAYGYMANAYLWAPGAEPTRRLPRSLAIAFARLSEQVGRPPVLSYANSQLCNWRRKDPNGPLSVENIAAIQVFQDLPDEEWFWVTHIAIEAAGGRAVMAGAEAVAAAAEEEPAGLEAALETISQGLEQVTALARRIEEGCSPDIFFRTLRPFLFSPPEGIVFEGVERFGGRPQAFLGQTGAQSSLMPALCAALGVRHAKSDLTTYLSEVRAYMPQVHRDFILALDGARLRRFVRDNRSRRSLLERYNGCIERIAAFRRLHLRLAATFIASKVADPRGTGGTEFMRWLRQMTKETQEQLL